MATPEVMEETGAGETRIPTYSAQEYIDLLWQTVDELAALKKELEAHRNALYELIATDYKRTLNLHEQEKLRASESEYTQLGITLQDILDKEKAIQEALLELESGTIDRAKLAPLLPHGEQDQRSISRRKQHILKERARQQNATPDPLSGHSFPGNVEHDVRGGYGANAGDVTTGRHRKRLNETLDPSSAADEFYWATADTHGGKVEYGKTRHAGSSYYTTVGGRKIRKR